MNDNVNECIRRANEVSCSFLTINEDVLHVVRYNYLKGSIGFHMTNEAAILAVNLRGSGSIDVEGVERYGFIFILEAHTARNLLTLDRDLFLYRLRSPWVFDKSLIYFLLNRFKARHLGMLFHQF